VKGGGRTCRRIPTSAEEERASRPPSSRLQAGKSRRTRSADAHEVQTPSSPTMEGGRRVTKRPRKGDRRGVSESRREVNRKIERNEPRHAGKEWNGGMREDGSKTRSLLLGRPQTTGRTARWRGHHANYHTPFFPGCDHLPSKMKRRIKWRSQSDS